MSNGDPVISIVMYDGGYRERFHLIDCLSSQTLSSDLYEMIWVEYYQELVDGITKKERELDNLDTYILGSDEVFFPSKCQNKGIRESSGEIIVLIDADLYVENDFLERIKEEHQRNSNLALYFNRLNQPKPGNAEMASVDGARLKRECEMNVPNCYGACLSIRKEWLEEVNGFEEHPVMAGRLNAGPMELNVRLKNFGIDEKWYPQKFVYHPWHPTEGYEEQTEHRFPQKFRKEARFKVIEKRELSLEYRPYQGLDSNQHGDPSWIDDYYESWKNRATKRRIENGLRKLASYMGLAS